MTRRLLYVFRALFRWSWARISTPNSIPLSSGAVSGPTAEAAPSAPPASPISRMFSLSGRIMAAFGKPMTPAAPGIRFSTTSPPARSAPLRSRPRIPISSMWAAARDCSAPTFPWATACTNRPTAARPGSHFGLRDGQQIPAILVDPGNPDRLFVAVLGHPYGPNPERGVYRSIDGGHSSSPSCTRMSEPARSTWPSTPPTPGCLRGALAGAARPVGKRQFHRPE